MRNRFSTPAPLGVLPDKVVEGDGVAAGDLPLLLFVEILDGLVQLVGRAGELRVRVGIIRRPDDAVSADEGRTSGERKRGLVGVESDPALAAEVLRRCHL